MLLDDSGAGCMEADEDACDLSGNLALKKMEVKTAFLVLNKTFAVLPIRCQASRSTYNEG